jgi:hypothetical protein
LLGIVNNLNLKIKMEILTSIHGSRFGLSDNDDLVVNGQLAVANPSSRIVDVATSTLTVTRDEHDSRTITLDRVAGSTITLPQATGSGAKYRFAVKTTVTSNGYIIKVANATDVFTGRALVCQDGGDTVVGFETAASSDTITLNGTTTGGYRGDVVEIEDIASGLFLVKVSASATGTEATPFSATVS